MLKYINDEDAEDETAFEVLTETRRAIPNYNIKIETSNKKILMCKKSAT